MTFSSSKFAVCFRHDVCSERCAAYSECVLPCSYYSELAGHENAAKYQTVLFLAGSASAEFFADVGLCPFEAVKVRWTEMYTFSSNLFLCLKFSFTAGW